MRTSELIKVLEEYKEKGDPVVAITFNKIIEDQDGIVEIELYSKNIVVELSRCLDMRDNVVHIRNIERVHP